MDIFITILVTFFAGMGAGLGTGFAGMSAAAVISPMLITFLNMDPYMAVGICTFVRMFWLSAVSGLITYIKNKNTRIDQKRFDYDGECACVYDCRQLCCKHCSISYNGRIFRVYDIFARHKIYHPSRYDN